MSLPVSSQSLSNNCFGRLLPATWFYCWAWHYTAQTLWSMEVSHADCVHTQPLAHPQPICWRGKIRNKKSDTRKIWQQQLKPWCAINAVLVSEQQHYTTLATLHSQWREWTSFPPDLIQCICNTTVQVDNLTQRGLNCWASYPKRKPLRLRGVVTCLLREHTTR